MNDTETERTGQPNDHITREIPGLLRAVAVGCAIGAVSVFVAVGGTVYLSQHDVAGALALGGMSAIWGGLGFGAMFGGTIHLTWHSDETHSSTKVLGSESAPRALEVIEVPFSGRTHVAEEATSDDPRAAGASSQVA